MSLELEMTFRRTVPQAAGSPSDGQAGEGSYWVDREAPRLRERDRPVLAAPGSTVKAAVTGWTTDWRNGTVNWASFTDCLCLPELRCDFLAGETVRHGCTDEIQYICTGEGRATVCVAPAAEESGEVVHSARPHRDERPGRDGLTMDVDSRICVIGLQNANAVAPALQ